MTEHAERYLNDSAAIDRLLGSVHRIAVLGIKPESHAGQPAHYVPRYMSEQGYEIVPVPVYYPQVTEILGTPVVRSLREIEGEIDLVLVFRRPRDVPQHLDEMLEARPKAVWMQSGIRHAETAAALARNGIDVVQDRCVMIEHRIQR